MPAHFHAVDLHLALDLHVALVAHGFRTADAVELALVADVSADQYDFAVRTEGVVAGIAGIAVTAATALSSALRG